AVVHAEIAEAGGAGPTGEGHAEAHLVPLAPERPLLREDDLPTGAPPGMMQEGGVLHHAGVLVVRFLHEEAVVANRWSLGRTGGGRNGAEGEEGRPRGLPQEY